MTKWILTICIIIIIGLAAIALQPVSSSRDKSKVTTGVITQISEGGTKDAVFHLQGTSESYYINRALENLFTLNDLRTRLVGKKVTIAYADKWTPLDPFGKASNPVTELKLGDNVLYSSLKN